MPQESRDRSPLTEDGAAQSEGSPPSSRHIKAGTWLIVGCLTWLSLVYLPKDVLGPELMDPSIQGSLSYFAEKQIQFGPQIMFTYGPFGYLMPEVYDGLFFKRKLLAELASKILIVAVILAIARELSVFRRALFFGAVWIICPSFGHSYPEVLFYFCIAALVPIFAAIKTSRPFFVAPSLVFLAFVSLIKFPSLVYSAFVVAALSACFAFKKNWKWAAFVPGAYGLLLLLGWALGGQRLTNFPIWIRTSLEIVAGYTQCMGLEPGSGILPLAIAVLVTALVLFVIWMMALKRETVACLSLLALAAGYWVSWRHGLVRADDHVNLFFGFCLLGFISFPAFALTKRNFPISAALAGLGGVLCLIGMYRQDSSFVTAAPQRALSNLLENVRHLSLLPSYEANLREKLATEKTRSECPNIKAEVDRATVDMFGYNQAIVLLNELNYRPRPVFQSYGTYTPSLIQANADFYRSANAPAYVVSSLATVDDHFPTEDDPEALRVLLLDYELMFAEKGWLLWRRSSVIRKPDEELNGIASTQVPFGQDVSVPGTNVWCAIDIPQKWRGKIRNFFYKPRPLAVEFVDETQHRSIYRILPTVTRSGFILDPYLLSDSDVLGLKTNFASPPKHLISFRLRLDESSRKYFADSATVHFSRIRSLSSHNDTAPPALTPGAQRP